jgi:transcriptional regulator with XRE-family HTH domain
MPARIEPSRPLTNLRALRERAGLSQDELALRVRISQPKLSRLERGYLRATPQECERLAHELGVAVVALGDRAAGADAGGTAG